MKKLITILALLALTATSQTPQTLNYQGYLADSNGDPVNGSENITFRIYNVSTGGSALWTEARTVTINDGVFSVVLGENTPINITFDNQYYLGITVGGSELTPRTKLASAPSVVNASSGGLPAGGIIQFGGTSAPTGWLLCDGSAVSRTTYADLFAAIGTAYGEGDGATTFNLPDMRGRFARGADNGAGNDPDAAGRTASNPGGNTGDNVGSLQADAIRNITGTVTNGGSSGLVQSAAQLTGAFELHNQYINGIGENSVDEYGIRFDASNVVPTGSDNRPVNISFNYIIKY